jgi:DNA repair exonuclease SbcCD nuclease subunit
MRILVSADWHIKLGQKNVPRSWQLNRYKSLFEKIYALEADVDAHILAGDVFDNVPKPDEVSLFFDFVGGCGIPTYIFDGNHEAGRKGQTFLDHFTQATNKVNNLVSIIKGNTPDLPGIDIIAYTDLKTFKPSNYHNKILFTHVRGSIPPHVKPEIDLSLLARWEVVLAGDLHSYSNCQDNILYPGSPLSITFHRAPITNGVIIFDTETLEHEWIDLELPQLIRKTVSSEAEIVKTTFDHTIYEIEGTMLDLSGIDTDSEIVDKLVLTTDKESKLSLHNLSIEEELNKYLLEILGLSESEISSIQGVFNDYVKNAELE